MAEVKIIGSAASLFSVRVEWALKLKGIEYEYIPEDVRNKSELLLKSNPVHKKIPVLLHHGKAISESLLILEYIDETWKDNPLMPEDPYNRAMARFWAKFLDEKGLLGAWEACQAEGEEKEKAVEAAIQNLALLDKEIQGKKFFGGDEIGYLDLAAGWMCHWLSVLDEVGEMKVFDKDRVPSLHEWVQDFVHIPVIKESLPPREDLVNYFKGSLSYVRSLAANKQ
ncbi:probable glutathione S-transferase [Cucurbita moschata]|uniref:Glutathione S-transferase n=1 Tax=Cucurbita moschata TaxID=3662 RepID=A0A6J1EM08_CUCMO|nr:probable glutathione S-transferase [Cucurbita moschata]